MAHVLSHLAGPMDLLAFGMLAFIRWYRIRSVDTISVLELLTPFNIPWICAAYRPWFETWGKKHWTAGKPTEDIDKRFISQKRSWATDKLNHSTTPA